MKANNSIVSSGNKPKFSVAIMGDSLQNMIAKSMPSRDEASRLTGALLQMVSTSPQLQNCQPATIVASALRGEGMGLVLGQGYYVVPYKDKASFLVSYKGYIQLALATGKYADLDCLEVREGEVKGRNPRTGKPVVDFSVYETDEERMKHPVIGYYAYFELKDGMFKSEYWSLDKILAHADKHSVAFNLDAYNKILAGKISEKDKWKYSSPWYDLGGGQEAMCKKTVLRSLLNSGYAPITNAVRTLINQEVSQEKTGERVITPEMLKVEKELGDEAIEVSAEVVTEDGEIKEAEEVPTDEKMTDAEIDEMVNDFFDKQEKF